MSSVITDPGTGPEGTDRTVMVSAEFVSTDLPQDKKSSQWGALINILLGDLKHWCGCHKPSVPTLQQTNHNPHSTDVSHEEVRLKQYVGGTKNSFVLRLTPRQWGPWNPQCVCPPTNTSWTEWCVCVWEREARLPASWCDQGSIHSAVDQIRKKIIF